MCKSGSNFDIILLICLGISIDSSIKIKELREKTFLTQEELAEKLGVSFVSVNRWENKHYVPTMKIRRKLKKFFDEAGINIYE